MSEDPPHKAFEKRKDQWPTEWDRKRRYFKSWVASRAYDYPQHY